MDEGRCVCPARLSPGADFAVSGGALRCGLREGALRAGQSIDRLTEGHLVEVRVTYENCYNAERAADA